LPLVSGAEEEGKKILTFGDKLFAEQEYYRAITEYRRFISYFPDYGGIDEVYFKICDSYFCGEKYLESIKWCRKTLNLTLQPDVSAQTNVILGNSYLKLKNYPSGRKSYSEIFNVKKKNPVYDDIAHLKLGLCDLYEEKYKQASREFACVKSNSPYFGKAQLFSKKAPEGELLRQKSRFKAGLFSVVPGLGYLYTGKKQTAVASFVINGLFLWGTLEAFNKDENGAGVVLGLFSFGFYSGNVYGSVISADRYNSQIRENFCSQFETY